MRHPMKRGLLLVVLLWGALLQLTAQNTYVHLVITMNDGREETYDMLNTSYMYFEEGVKLIIAETVDGLTAVSYPLADIRKITCQEVEGTPENADLDIVLSPNPVHDIVTFRNLHGTHTANIYALDGRLVKSIPVTEGQPVDISELSTGLYIVNIGYCTFKMMKL